MKVRFSIDGKRVTRKHVLDLVGKDRLNEMLKVAKQTMQEDPLIENDFYLGMNIGMLTIQLDPWN